MTTLVSNSILNRLPKFFKGRTRLFLGQCTSVVRFAEQQFQNDVKKAANHILSNFQRLKYGPVALEMPYMLQDKFQVEEQLVYDKDTATGLQSGICTQY